MPEKLKDQIFEKLFADAELAKYSEEELMAYDASIKAYRDNYNTIHTAHEEGRAEGRAEGAKEKQEEIAKAMLASGLPKEKVAEYTGLSMSEIDSLIRKD